MNEADLSFRSEKRGSKRGAYLDSWCECVEQEFGQSKTHLYRQLEAAQIERDISPWGNHLDGAQEKVLELYEREGWRSLGYDFWRECVEEEFGARQRHLYYQLEAAQIERDLHHGAKIGTIPERQLRPLAQVEPERRKEPQLLLSGPLCSSSYS